MTSSIGLGVLVLLALVGCRHVGAVQAPKVDHAMMGGPRMAGACEASASANVGKHGCYFDQAITLGVLSAPAYYQVDEYADAATASKAKARGSVVVAAYGRVFLQTVTTDAGWRAAGGHHLATVGPMEVPRGEPLIARFMQAMTLPGASTRPHRHHGPEAFYVLSGAICMETTEGVRTTGAGQTYWVRGGVPMQLTSTGDGERRSLFVVVHGASQPWMTMTPSWIPRGACAG